MRLRLKLWVYLTVVHAAVAAVLIWQRELLGWWLFPLEIALVLSFLLGLRLMRHALAPLETARKLAEVIESGEYGFRYPLVGQAEVDGVIGAYNRMLARLQQEWLRLGEQRGFLEQFLRVTPVGVVILDFDGCVSLANPRARTLLGVGESDLNGCALAELESASAGMLASLRVGEVRLITDTVGRRLRCQRGEFHDRGFARPYILIEELTEELNRSERATYEKLIRMISHEVTNTVAATNSLLESCLRYADQMPVPADSDDYRNALGILIARNRNLNEFTTAFTELVKLPEPNRQELSIPDLLMTVQTIFKAELERRDIALHLAVEGGLLRVRADRSQMEQVMINVTKNAIEAIDRGGHIELAAARDGAFVDISVLDDGAGLDEVSKSSLFTPFFTSKGQGQGLGLTLVKEILTQHGFGFSLDSEQGRTRFRIRIPVVPELRVPDTGATIRPGDVKSPRGFSQ